MDEMNACELAFKNGYEKGKADAAAEIFDAILKAFDYNHYEDKWEIYDEEYKSIKKKFTEGVECK